MTPASQDRPGSVRFAVRLTPRGGADRVERVSEEGALIVRVAAPAVDGAANEALVRLLARELGVPPSAVRLVTGASNRSKVVAVTGVDVAQLARRWPRLRL